MPSRFYTDPQQAAEASELARQVVEVVSRRLEDRE